MWGNVLFMKQLFFFLNIRQQFNLSNGMYSVSKMAIVGTRGGEEERRWKRMEEKEIERTSPRSCFTQLRFYYDSIYENLCDSKKKKNRLYV